MRFLLLSDTHGKLDIINALAEQVEAEAVIHAGDFGFYDQGSYERLSDRELRLLLFHSGISKPEKDRAVSLSRGDLLLMARDAGVLGDFPKYLEGGASFHVPVYAVWGNHEDREVVERLSRGQESVDNLFLLDHRRGYCIGSVFLFGLGGNLLPGKKMMQKPLAGGGGKIWSTLAQYAQLVETSEKEPAGQGLRFLVSHVSPGKEPLIELLGARTRADLTISGHMGAPTTNVWNAFSISTVEDAEKRLREGLETLRSTCLVCAGADLKSVEGLLADLGNLPVEKVHIGRGRKAPRWYRGMTHINLPDAHVGYAVLDVEDSAWRLHTHPR